MKGLVFKQNDKKEIVEKETQILFLFVFHA